MLCQLDVQTCILRPSAELLGFKIYSESELTESALAIISLIPGLCSGILVTGTVVLEALAQCGTAAFDKTGTLTTGRLAATSMRAPAGTAHLEDTQNGVHCSACAI